MGFLAPHISAPAVPPPPPPPPAPAAPAQAFAGSAASQAAAAAAGGGLAGTILTTGQGTPPAPSQGKQLVGQ